MQSNSHSGGSSSDPALLLTACFLSDRACLLICGDSPISFLLPALCSHRLQQPRSLHCLSTDRCSSSLCVNPFKESTSTLFDTSPSNRPPHQCHQWSRASYCCHCQPSRRAWHPLPSVFWSRQLCSSVDLWQKAGHSDRCTGNRLILLIS